MIVPNEEEAPKPVEEPIEQKKEEKEPEKEPPKPAPVPVPAPKPIPVRIRETFPTPPPPPPPPASSKINPVIYILIGVIVLETLALFVVIKYNLGRPAPIKVERPCYANIRT